MTVRIGARAIARRARAFVADTRAGATAIAAAAVTVMSVGASALIIDHVWLVDQRDVLKIAAEAGAIAATLELDRQLAKNPRISDDDLEKALHSVATGYVLTNLKHLPSDRLLRAKDTLEVEITELDRAKGTVGVTAKADLGGTLFSRNLPLLGNYAGPEKVAASAGVESEATPVEVVLAIDVSSSMGSDLQGKRAPGGDNRMAIVKRAATRLVDILDPDAHNRVAVGVVPWHQHVRLDAATAQAWVSKRWARYPTRRRYEVPYTYCNISRPESCKSGAPAAVEQALPATAPEPWQGCITEDRLATGATHPDLPPVADLLDLPAQRAFAQSFFQATWGYAYQCLDPDAEDAPDDFLFQACHKRAASDTSTDLVTNSFGTYVFFKNYKSILLVDAQDGCEDDSTILPLSTDPDTVRSAIDSLDAIGGYTYSALGVLWGHRLLLSSWKGASGGSGAHPVDPGGSDADKVRKAIVLLTDGDDTQCGFNNPGCDGTSRLGVARSDACTAAKAAGIEIFVVAAVDPDKVSSGLKTGLENCSSKDDNPDGTYVFLNNATTANLEAAFADIAHQLRSLRRTS